MDKYCEQVDWKRSEAVRKQIAAEQWNGVDCPWWYTERANVGLFAAGAVRVGEVALEEFNDEKGHGRSKYAGRVDLMIWQGARTKSAAFEAKMAWAQLKERTDSVDWDITTGTWNSVERNWRAAQKAARAVHSDYHRYALLFVPVVMRQPDLSGKRLSVALDAVAQKMKSLDRKPGLIAYYSPQRFDRKGRIMHAQWSNQGKRHPLRSHVGVALAAKRI